MFFMLFKGEFVVFYSCILLLNLVLQDVHRPMQFINLYGIIYKPCASLSTFFLQKRFLIFFCEIWRVIELKPFLFPS